jgi:hypothetical protein
MNNLFSRNWCGALVKNNQIQPRGFNSVWACWTVPKLERGEGDGPWHAAFWVGLDGGSNSPGYSQDCLHAGVRGKVAPDGVTVKYEAFWEWSPDDGEELKYGDGGSIPVDAGHHVFVKVQYLPADAPAKKPAGAPAKKPAGASIEFVNYTAGHFFVRHDFQPPKSKDFKRFQGDTIEWILERCLPDYKHAPDKKNYASLAHFGGMDFNLAGGERADNSLVSPKDGGAIDMTTVDRRNHHLPKIIVRAKTGPDSVHIHQGHFV